MPDKNRLVVLEIDFTELQEFDAFDLGEVLQSLPEDTKIVSFGQEMCFASLKIVLNNPNFKPLAEAGRYPTIRIKELSNGNLITTLTAQHFEHPEGYVAKCYEADQRELALEDVNFDHIVGHFSFDEMKDHYLDSVKYGISISKVDMENKEVTFTRTGISAQLAELDNSTEAFCNFKIQGDPSLKDNECYIRHDKICYSNISTSESFPEATLEKRTCNHTWQHYTGLTQQYDFCTICDEKRVE